MSLFDSKVIKSNFLSLYFSYHYRRMSQFWKGSDHYSAVPFFSDADMNSENNRKELAWACGKYLL